MDDLIAFLNARLDEDEAAARTAAAASPTPWTIAGAWLLDATGLAVVLDENLNYEETFPHIVRHDPARVLRDVEADRKLITAFKQADADAQYPDYDGGYATGLEDAAKIRAERFSDHPDYREDWKS